MVNGKARWRHLRARLCVNTGGFSYWRVMLREFVLASFQTMYGAVARRRCRKRKGTLIRGRFSVHNAIGPKRASSHEGRGKRGVSLR